MTYLVEHTQDRRWVSDGTFTDVDKAFQHMQDVGYDWTTVRVVEVETGAILFRQELLNSTAETYDDALNVRRRNQDVQTDPRSV